MTASVRWDGSNADDLKAVAGDRFEGVAALPVAVPPCHDGRVQTFQAGGPRP